MLEHECWNAREGGRKKGQHMRDGGILSEHATIQLHVGQEHLPPSPGKKEQLRNTTGL